MNIIYSHPQTEFRGRIAECHTDIKFVKFDRHSCLVHCVSFCTIILNFIVLIVRILFVRNTFSKRSTQRNNYKKLCTLNNRQ